jgi:hypothetical protein
VAEEDGRLYLRLLRSLSQTKEFRQAQLVGIAGWAVTVGLNPFRMLNAQILVNLSLKFGVGMNFVRHGNSSVIGSTENAVHFHNPSYRWQSCSRHGACAGFLIATPGVIRDPSFGVEHTRVKIDIGLEIASPIAS